MTQQGYYQQPPPPPQYPPQYLPAGNRFHLHGDIVQRFISLIIDGIILIIIYVALVAILIVAGIFSGSVFGLFGFTLAAAAISIMSFLIVFIYFVVQEGGSKNTTIGKSAMNLKVVDENYQPIDMSKAAIRNLMRALWSLPFALGFIFFIIDVILVLVREDRQRLGDIVAHTYVVREDAAIGPQPYYAPPPPQYAPPPPPPPQYQQPPPEQQP